MTLDPHTWVETVEAAHRDQTTLTIVYDDTTHFNDTTMTQEGFQLQPVYSISG